MFELVVNSQKTIENEVKENVIFCAEMLAKSVKSKNGINRWKHANENARRGGWVRDKALRSQNSVEKGQKVSENEANPGMPKKRKKRKNVKNVKKVSVWVEKEDKSQWQ